MHTNTHLSVHPLPAPMKHHRVSEHAVHCIHCGRRLGIATDSATRARLVRGHACVQGMLDRQPASPPPFN